MFDLILSNLLAELYHELNIQVRNLHPPAAALPPSLPPSLSLSLPPSLRPSLGSVAPVQRASAFPASRCAHTLPRPSHGRAAVHSCIVSFHRSPALTSPSGSLKALSRCFPSRISATGTAQSSWHAPSPRCSRRGYSTIQWSARGRRRSSSAATATGHPDRCTLAAVTAEQPLRERERERGGGGEREGGGGGHRQPRALS